MNPRLLRPAIAVAALLALVLAWRWWDSEERRLWSRWVELENAFAKRGDEGQLGAVARTKAILDFFAPGFRISAAPYEGTVEDREQLAGLVHRYRENARTIEVTDSGRGLAIRDNGTAEMRCVVSVRGDGPNGPGEERFRARIGWRRDEGVWTIAEFEILERLDSSSGLGF